jgi:hypothetical protein
MLNHMVNHVSYNDLKTYLFIYFCLIYKCVFGAY